VRGAGGHKVKFNSLLVLVKFCLLFVVYLIEVAFVKYLRKKWEYNETVHQLFIDFKKAYDSFRKEILYNILNEFIVPMNVEKLIKMCLNETCSIVRVGKHLSDIFPIRNGLK
jgi:uncharacterized protein Yka (UPF0111/DUF47 family)